MLDQFLGNEVTVPTWEGTFILDSFTESNGMTIAQLKRTKEDTVNYPVNIKIVKKDGKYLEIT